DRQYPVSDLFSGGFMFNKIICAIDGAAITERILLYAMHFGRKEGAVVHIVHAYQLPENYATQDGYDELAQAYRAMARGVVEDARAFLEDVGLQVTGEAIEGPPAQVVLEEADRVGADLILVGHRNPKDVTEMLLGSVSQQILNQSRIPVLVIP
ncbi:MAG TPA: universal stress protein, partial [Caldilineales bacterium]|nr:universal stress protein [Caldilineales bacterium]